MRLLLILLVCFFTSATHAQSSGGIYIKVGDPNLKKSLLAMPEYLFLGTPSVAKNYMNVGKELFDTVYFNLTVSSYFNLIDKDAFPSGAATTGLRPAPGEPNGFKFESWRQLQTDFLIRVGYKILNGNLVVEAYLYYVPQAKQVFGKTYKAAVKDARLVAHTFSNDVVQNLTGKQGIFKSRLVTARTTVGQQKEIFVMDWDGHNAKPVSNHKSVALSPAWSPDGKTIAYTAFAYHANTKQRNIDLFTYELSSGRRWLVAFKKGINSGASFTKDGKRILFTSSSDGNPDIYSMTLEGKDLKALTNGPNKAMNVEAVMSPDGSKIAFSSDRSGKPMIYIMNSDGTNPVRVTFAGIYNSSPAWSPDGKKLAFAGMDKGGYDIFVMNADGTNMVRLTSAKKSNGTTADNEDPSFSPDGRHIMFTSNRAPHNRKQIYVVDINGDNERRITFDTHNYFKPKWSPTFE